MLEQHYKSILDGSGGNCLTCCKNNHVVVIGINKNIKARRCTRLRCRKVSLRHLERFQLSARNQGNRRQTRSDGIELNGASIPPHQLRRNFECSFIWLKTNPCYGHVKPFTLLSTSTTDGALDFSSSNQQSSQPSGIASSTPEGYKSSIVVEQEESGCEGSLRIDLSE